MTLQHELTFMEAANLANDHQVHVLFDLSGHTSDSRVEMFGSRPCPVQAHYIGYIGTTGADFVDYYIADAVVAPPEVQI